MFLQIFEKKNEKKESFFRKTKQPLREKEPDSSIFIKG